MQNKISRVILTIIVSVIIVGIMPTIKAAPSTSPSNLDNT